MIDWRAQSEAHEHHLQTQIQLVLLRDRRALAQTISLIESEQREKRALGDQILQRLLKQRGGQVCLRLGVSGVAGAGKSTLINALGRCALDVGLRLAVLTVDPSSAINQGSLLGDSVRMGDIIHEPNVFVRSTPSGSEAGGVARATPKVVQLCEVAGFDLIIVESLGSGQVEFELAHCVDLLYWLTTPGAGDDLQAMKQGVLEWVDGVVITQADRGRESIAKESKMAYEQGLSLSSETPVTLVSSLDQQQVNAFWGEIQRQLQSRLGWAFSQPLARADDGGALPEAARLQLCARRQARAHRRLYTPQYSGSPMLGGIISFDRLVAWLQPKLSFGFDWISEFLPQFLRTFGFDGAKFSWQGVSHAVGARLTPEETSHLGLSLPVDIFCESNDEQYWQERGLPFQSVLFIPLSVMSSDIQGGEYASIVNSEFRFLLGYRLIDADTRKKAQAQSLPVPLLLQWGRVLQCLFYEVELLALQQVIRPRNLSSIDELTGLSNRESFCQHLDELLIRLQSDEASSDQAVNVYGIDIDDFRRVNEALGLEAGDQLLCLVAQVLQSLMEPWDLVARFGGDEFFLCKIYRPNAHEKPEEVAHAFGDRIQQEINKAVSQQMSQVTRVQCHIGCVALVFQPSGATGAHNLRTTNELLRAAGAALFSAKSLGREGVFMYDAQLRQRAHRQFVTKNELFQAMAEDQFTYLAQPLINQKTGKVFGAELLLRWRHPRRGILAASEFIESATGLGILQENDLRLIFKDLKSIVAIAKTHQVIFHLNLSAQLFFDEDIIEFAIALERRGALPYLHFEITEHAFVHRLSILHQFIHRVRRGGSQVWLDDFGVGYSGLRYLDALDIDGVKIDQSFTRRLKQPRTRTLLRGMMSLLTELGLGVLTEGVETQEQAACLTALGCERQQGLVHGAALPLDDFVAFIDGSS